MVVIYACFFVCLLNIETSTVFEFCHKHRRFLNIKKKKKKKKEEEGKNKTKKGKRKKEKKKRIGAIKPGHCV